MGIIYKITNIKNGKIYIGQTIRDLLERWYHHVYYAFNGKPTKLARAIRKYGEKNFIIEAIEITDNLDDREIFWIDFYKSTKRGYNIKVGGNGGPHSESTKRKIAKANSSREWTKDMRENMSSAIKKWHKERGFVARDDSFKKKISEANRGRKMSIKTKTIFQSHNESNKKPLICMATGHEYDSIASASRELGLNKGQLGQHLKGKHKSVKGFVFKYK